jgi:hypothetical protein
MIRFWGGIYFTDLQEEDVELAKLLLSETDCGYTARISVTKEFQHSLGSLPKADAIVKCALEQMGKENVSH